MHVLVDHETSRQHRKEIQREVASNRLEKTARTNRESRPRFVLDLGWELARYAELLGKRLRGIG